MEGVLPDTVQETRYHLLDDGLIVRIMTLLLRTFVIVVLFAACFCGDDLDVI